MSHWKMARWIFLFLYRKLSANTLTKTYEPAITEARRGAWWGSNDVNEVLYAKSIWLPLNMKSERNVCSCKNSDYLTMKKVEADRKKAMTIYHTFTLTHRKVFDKLAALLNLEIEKTSLRPKATDTISQSYCFNGSKNPIIKVTTFWPHVDPYTGNIPVSFQAMHAQ